MKIIKLSNGNVIIQDNDGLTRNGLPPICALRRDGGTADKIYVSSGQGKEVEINYASITHTVIDSTETPFTGDCDDLMNLLIDVFFTNAL